MGREATPGMMKRGMNKRKRPVINDP